MKLRQFFGRVAIAAVVISSVFLISHGCAANLRASGATVYQFFRAVGAGDAPTACHLLSGAALAKIQTSTGTSSCHAAVTQIHIGLTQAERERLVRGEADVREYCAAIAGDFSSREELVFDNNPLGMQYILLAEHEGRETISDWGWNTWRVC
ncbi:hypothetical protein [Kibdelosporangium phytohabitans]|uniref:Uncharacterized protein n=1 Tax=Kibdelosporangium phytohabitans TaxID=860235 RepID=A0A0N9I1R7_9PSEU|nr:hypothetical protein [Kibdelosporangium phytohabitans]ALG08150.1 hypothetical protein AOZ06_15605 [Kibdelosporangium phytohabitans]MBE1470866.1 hypothetical protein [Kibdelosporangium phytohabitans]